MKTTLLFALLTLTFMGIFYACTKGSAESGSATTFKVNLTDNPLAAQEVNIDLKEVRVNFKEGSEQWFVLKTNSGIYNLLDFQNGADTTIATGIITEGNITELRLVLGANNSVKMNDVVYPLTIPSGSETGLKIKLGQNFKKGNEQEVTIDFDAALSVHQTENGTYELKPVLKLK